MKSAKHDLDIANHHVAETQWRIDGQIARIARLKAEDQPTEAAEELLHALQSSLALFQKVVAALSVPTTSGVIPDPHPSSRPVQKS